MAATIVNLQRKTPLDTKSLAPFANSLFQTVDEARGKTAAIAFISDRRMKELNSFFRGKNSTTDVLSFPHEPEQFELTTDHRPLTTDFLGDIVISVEQAARQAEENGLTLENEIKQLILHGLLHLCGYDHETDNGEMNARELGLREKLGI
jgi:probable rRNA maturation factor